MAEAVGGGWKSFVALGLFVGSILYPLFGAWNLGRRMAGELGNSMISSVGFVTVAGFPRRPLTCAASPVSGRRA